LVAASKVPSTNTFPETIKVPPSNVKFEAENEPVNNPLPPCENEAVSANDELNSLNTSTDAETAYEADIACDDVTAVKAWEAVANGDRVFAIIETEAVWANIAVDEEIAVTAVKSEPSPWNEPLPPFLTVLATVAIEADSTEPDTEVSKVIVVPSPLLRVITFWLTLPAITPRSGKDAVVALSAR